MSETVLIVDDSATVRMNLAEAFESAGFKVLPCSSGREARETLAQQHPSLLLLDVVLPDVDGVELLKEIRSDPTNKGLSILVLSTEAEVKDRIRGLETGADDYVGKPYDAGYVVARGRELVRSRSEPPVATATVLVIDDSATFREILRSALERAGYRVVTAVRGEEGLRLAAVEKPAAVLVDSSMPGLDGATVIRRIRLDAALRDTPCLLMTASEGDGAELSALDAGADAFVRKEQDLEIVLARLAAVLRAVEPAPRSVRSLEDPKRILVVDHGSSYREELASLLRAEGCDVVLARSGEEAFEMLAVQTVDCILLHMLIPGDGGTDVCRRIKGTPGLRNVPLIMLSEVEDRAAAIAGLANGADDFLSNTNDLEVIKAHVQAQLRRKQFEDENRRVREQLLANELELSEQRAARQVAEARAELAEELERKNRELDAFGRSAKAAADRLESAVESIQDAVALFDDRGYLVFCNSAYQRLVEEALPGPLEGMPYERLLDALIDRIEFQSDDERERYRASRLTGWGREPMTAFDLRMRDGRSLRVVDRRTKESGTVKTIYDLTDDVRLTEEVWEARHAAEAASSAKSEFLSSMSHELRTPLNAILGFAQLLARDKKDPPSARQKGRIDEILKGGAHLLRLIEDILDLARIEARGVSISPEAVGVGEVLEEVRSTLGPMAAERKVRMEIEPISETLPAVAVDRTRFIQILMNLGSNALKYNRPEGSVSFVVSVPTRQLVRILVRDTGIGIALEHQEKLFQPFQRAGHETGPIEGTGIGLVVTRQLARLMHGDVGFRSTPGEGSEFWVDVPIHASELRPSSMPPAPAAEAAGGVAKKPKHVLYVEDNPANVIFMSDLMATLDDVHLVTAPTAELGLDLAREQMPDVVIMDLNLPGMSGLDALRALRAASETKNIPVIALTAAAFASDRERGIAAGFYRYLTKPVKVQELVSTLEALFAAQP